ncbi:MAG: FHA domain-containing protein, partial [Lentisphaeria bacterium]|nr:FHA domain-containing protein [Lentisphaeria bacterium]
MIQLTLIIPGQGKNDLPLPDGQYRVGAAGDTNIQLPYPGVSKQHCILSVKGDILEVQDTNSSNGTFVNENRSVPGQFYQVQPGDTIRVGNLLLMREGTPVKEPEKPQAVITSAPVQTPAPASAPEKLPVSKLQKDGEEVPILKISGVPQKAMQFVQEIKKRAHEELLKRLNLKRLAMAGNTTEEDLSRKAADTIHEILADLNIPLPQGVTIEKLEKDLFYEAIGLGPLEELIARDDISEIMVNGPDQVYVEHKGVLYKTDTCFADNQQVLAAIE